jgi:hypothetical protein
MTALQGAMAIENVRLTDSEVIDKDHPRLEAVMELPEAGFTQNKDGKWYVRGTGEPVTFATKRDEQLYKCGM